MATQDPTDALVKRAQTGDRDAFDTLVSRNRSRLERQIRTRMGAKVRASLEADDILQDTLTSAFESIAKFRSTGEDSFYRWLASIAEHLIWNASQKRRWGELRLEELLPGVDISPSRGMRRQERFARLERALGTLTADQRQAILLARVDGLKVKEIAMRMNRSPDAVGKILARAVLQLKEAFGDTESLHLPDRNLGVEERGHGD